VTVLPNVKSVGAPLLVPEQIRKYVGSRRIGFISGNFNVIHAGHIRVLKFAAEACDILVIGLNADGVKGVTVPLALRLEAMKAISLVHYVLEINEDVGSFIAKLRPDLVVKGKEFATQYNPEEASVEAYGGKLLFSAGELRFSTDDLIAREFSGQDRPHFLWPTDFPERHGFRMDELAGILPKFAGMRVLVIGDLIIDEYINCEALGMSQEDPTIVVTPINKKSFVGGAGIVSAHARGLGAEVEFLTVAGADRWADYARENLSRYNVEANVMVDRSRPTTTKARYRAAGKTLLRVNDLRQHAVDQELQSEMLRWIKARIKRTDLILFSDFNYGCLPQPLVDAVTEAARAGHVLMSADSQASSQMADISRFRHMQVITPTEREARLALVAQEADAGIAVVASQLRQKAQAKNVVVTLGAEGLILLGEKQNEERLDRLPAFNNNPKDVAGAGDSLFTCLSMALCAGEDVWRSCYLASVVAAIQVSRLGNLPIQYAEVMAELINRRH
jgi:rfaE bifunctional protein kinase chain/domain